MAVGVGEGLLGVGVVGVGDGLSVAVGDGVVGVGVDDDVGEGVTVIGDGAGWRLCEEVALTAAEVDDKIRLAAETGRDASFFSGRSDIRRWHAQG